MALVPVKSLWSCIPVGTQVCIKPALCDASVQCSLLPTTTRTSTPKKHVPSNIPFSDSDLSDIDVDRQYLDQSTVSYIPSSESCLS